MIVTLDVPTAQQKCISKMYKLDFYAKNYGIHQEEL